MTIDTSRLQQICESGLAAVGYELVELEYMHDQSGWVLRVYIDHPYDGRPDPADEPPTSRIGLADCELASRHLGTVLDVEDLISAAYRLEVSSPGVPRPVRMQRDFARFVGRRVRVELREALGEGGRKRFLGQLRSAEGGTIGVEVDGQLFSLPIEEIRRARLEESEPRQGGGEGNSSGPARSGTRAKLPRATKAKPHSQGRKRCSQT
jgi:ribosome maturation factor RimP